MDTLGFFLRVGLRSLSGVFELVLLMTAHINWITAIESSFTIKIFFSLFERLKLGVVQICWNRPPWKPPDLKNISITLRAGCGKRSHPQQNKYQSRFKIIDSIKIRENQNKDHCLSRPFLLSGPGSNLLSNSFGSTGYQDILTSMSIKCCFKLIAHASILVPLTIKTCWHH